MSSWKDKVVLVTGGSSGLGRAIAAEFARHGARVVIVARNPEALEGAAAALRAAGGDATAIAADVTQQESVDRLIAQVFERYGRLDVLVNNAGRSSRRAILDATPEDFQALLDLNLLAVVRMTRAAAPHLVRTKGHVVNIGSLAAKSASPYMGAYAPSKFAVAAYSQQLRLELAPQGLHVLLVCPGPIARDEPRSAESERAKEGTSGVPAAALKPGAGVRLKGLCPERVAAAILRACERREPEIVLPRKARLLFILAALSPRLGDWIVRRMTK